MSAAEGSSSSTTDKTGPFYEIKRLERLLHVFARIVHNQLDPTRRRRLFYKIGIISRRLRRLSSLSKDQKPTCEQDSEFKGTSENSTEAEGTTLLKTIDKDNRAGTDDRLKCNKEIFCVSARIRKANKPERYPVIAKGRKITKKIQGLYFPLFKGLIFSRVHHSKRRPLSKRQHSKDPSSTWKDVSEESHYVKGTTSLKPALPKSVALPKRRRSPSPQSSTSEDGSDVEDPDVEEVEDSTKVEDVTDVGEVEYSFDGEYSSDGTTLLKPAPYIAELRDEDPEVKEAIERQMKKDYYSQTKKDSCIDFIRLVSGDFGEHYFIAGPVFQVIAVHISSPNSKELKIHGHISVTDDKDNTYYIYKRWSECPERVSPGHEFLPLNRRPLLPLMRGNVEFSLRDGSDLIFERKLTVEYLSKYEDGHVRKLGFGGKDSCRATMFFTIIPYARIAEFTMDLWEPLPPSTEGAFQLHGRIKANKALCFRKTSEKPVEMWQGAFNHIGEFVLAVSVFSPLLLDVKLYRNGKKLAYEVYRVPFYNFSSREMKYECYDKKYELNVYLQWASCRDYFKGKKWSIGVCPQINKPTDGQTLVCENEKNKPANQLSYCGLRE